MNTPINKSSLADQHLPPPAKPRSLDQQICLLQQQLKTTVQLRHQAHRQLVRQIPQQLTRWPVLTAAFFGGVWLHRHASQATVPQAERPAPSAELHDELHVEPQLTATPSPPWYWTVLESLLQSLLLTGISRWLAGPAIFDTVPFDTVPFDPAPPAPAEPTAHSSTAESAATE